MSVSIDSVDEKLLDGWQRNFPLVSRPFQPIADQIGLSEDEVLERYRRLASHGAISRIGGTCRPNVVGASTLAAVAAPELHIEEVAGIINAEPGVNHSYLREDEWNIWFVATGPNRAYVDESLFRIAEKSGLRVLDLPLVRAFNVDLGFALNGGQQAPKTRQVVDNDALESGDEDIMDAMSKGLEITEKPFLALAEQLGVSEDTVLSRVSALETAGVLSRVGVIVRHRALGWRANAMVVWQVPEEKIEACGPQLMAVPGVTLCYQRRPASDVWPYTLYCMIHARSRDEAMSALEQAREIPALSDVPHRVLFSTRCFKQTGAMIVQKEKEAAA